MSRCTGHCCRSFCLPLSPIELAAAAEREQRLRDGTPREGDEVFTRYGDIEQIAEMVIYLGEWNRPPLARMKAGGPAEFDEPGHYYTCKYYGAGGNCAIYDDRPSTCREYPYDSPCSLEGCTYDIRNPMVQLTGTVTTVIRVSGERVELDLGEAE